MRTSALVFFFSLLASFLFSQEATLTGRVTDARGTPLVGATIRGLNSVLGTTTDTAGHFELEIPLEPLRMVFDYLGYQAVDTLIAPERIGAVVELAIVLREESLEFSEVIIYGRQSVGQTQALEEQRKAPNQQNILHAEFFNRYPDQNVAETLQRVPGVTISRTNGEAEFVQLGGLPENFAAVAINGQRLPSVQAEADRSVALDFIQSILLEEVRVSKALTPKMDADAIGGMADFQIRIPDRRWEVGFLAGGGLNAQHSVQRSLNPGVVQASAYLNQELSENEIYGLLGGAYYASGRGALREHYLYEGGADEITTARAADRDRYFQRSSLIGSIDLAISAFDRLRLAYNFSSTDAETVDREAWFQAFADDEIPTDNRLVVNERRQRSVHLVSLLVENNFRRLKLTYDMAFASSSDETPERNVFGFRSVYAPSVYAAPDLARVTPLTTVGNQPLAFVQASSLRQFLDEDVFRGSANLSVPLRDDESSRLEAGIRYRAKDRYLDYSDARFDPRSDFVAEDPTSYPFAANEGATPFLENRELRTATSQYFEAEEQILGTYLMNTTNWTGKFSTLLGARFERTDITFREGETPIERDSSYAQPFLSLNATYRFSPRRQLRLAYYEGIARPPYVNLISGFGGRNESNTLLAGNAAGRATIGRNLNLAYEVYGQRDGFFSVSLFAKFLADPYYRRTTVLTEPGEFELLRSVQLRNAAEGRVLAAEVAFYQNLSFLGPEWRFFNVNGSFSFNESEITGTSGTDLADLPFPGSPRRSGNLAFVYVNDAKGWSVVLTSVYKSSVLDRIEADRPVYRASTLFFDLAVDWRFYRKWSLFLRLNNVTDTDLEQYYGQPDEPGARLIQRERYGPWGVAGIRWRL
jgi:TonB-dependent receptor